MSEGVNESSVILIIKAPNQKIADYEVKCMLDWTVRNLKEHLALVYPTKPQQNHQRIIYSGQLLQDDQKLRDILRKNTLVNNNTHVMHLVWSPPKGEAEQANSTAENNSEQLLRHRKTAPASLDSASSDLLPPSNPSPTTSPNHLYHTVASQPNLMSPSGAYSTEQMAWMHQMYAQQWAHYMQYMQLYQPAQLTASFNVPANAFNISPPPYINEPARPVAAPIRAGGNNARDAVRGPVIQNQMGPIVNDDDEDGEARDWLDHVYSVCRFILLFAMVYFYSSIDRFIIVFALFISVYMFHIGWLQLRRRVPENRQPPPAPAPVDPREENQPSSEPTPNNSTTSPANESQVPALPPRPNYTAICWEFVSSFFTSLIPHHPAPVNVN